MLQKRDTDALVMQWWHDLKPEQRVSWLDNPNLLSPGSFSLLTGESAFKLGRHNGYYLESPQPAYRDDLDYQRGWRQGRQDKQDAISAFPPVAA